MSLAITNPYPKSGHRLAEWLLQVSVVVLGFGMNLELVLRAMARDALLASAIIVFALLLGLLLGRVLGIELRESALISAGTAICGGTAIVAVGSAVRAEEEDVTVAIGTVFLLNTAALYLFPLVGHALQLNQQQFGVWAGISIHDVSSVVASGDSYGPSAMQIATAVKLTRVVWILPLVWILRVAMNHRSRNRNISPEFPARRSFKLRTHIPWFIGAFLLACLVRRFASGVAEIAPVLTRFGEAGLTLTFFLMGAGISRKTIEALGWKAVTQGTVLWLFVSAASLFIILHRDANGIR